MPILGVLEYENILAGFQSEVVTEEVTVAKNQELSVGQIIALNSDGQAVALTKDDEVTEVYGIMADAVATGENETRPAVIYKRGEFNARKIIFPEGANKIELKKALSNIGIILRNTIPADPQGTEEE